MKIKWTTVRSFGKVKYFNVSYVVLLLVPLLSEMYTKAAGSSAAFRGLVAFPPTLRWLYSASLFYAIGIAIYQYLCPTVIKRFANSDEYVDYVYEQFLRAHPHRRLNIVLAQLEDEVDGDQKARLHSLMKLVEESKDNEKVNAKRDLDELVAQLHPDSVQRFLIKDYGSKNSERRVAIWASFVLYVVGSLILLALLTKRSCTVIFGS